MDQAQQLRNIIKQQNMQQHLARVITVTSGKGGVGKSNMSVNMAIQLGRLGKKVVILDADFGLANVEVMLGTRPRYNMADMIYGRKGIKDIICRGPENIGFISGGSGIKELSNLSKDQISGIVNMMYELDSIADVIIIDTGAGISDAVIDMVLASSEVLLVPTPEPTSITDAYALLKTINKAPGYSNDNIKIKYLNPCVVCVDSAMGKNADIGKIIVNWGGITLGKAVNNGIYLESHINIKGVVGKDEEEILTNFRELTLVNKNVIEKMSNEVTEGINKVINSIV